VKHPNGLQTKELFPQRIRFVIITHESIGWVDMVRLKLPRSHKTYERCQLFENPAISGHLTEPAIGHNLRLTVQEGNGLLKEVRDLGGVELHIMTRVIL